MIMDSSIKGYLERLNRSEDDLHYLLIVMLPSISPQMVIEQVLES